MYLLFVLQEQYITNNIVSMQMNCITTIMFYQPNSTGRESSLPHNYKEALVGSLACLTTTKRHW